MEAVVEGYELVNDLFGILSIFTNNYMHLYNAFTWLLVSLSCDYTANKDIPAVPSLLPSSSPATPLPTKPRSLSDANSSEES